MILKIRVIQKCKLLWRGNFNIFRVSHRGLQVGARIRVTPILRGLDYVLKWPNCKEWLTSGLSKLEEGEDWRLIGLPDRRTTCLQQ